MIKINKAGLPLVLNNDKAKEEFSKNIKAKKYVGKDIYKKVKVDLERLYKKKCAYCETNITAGAYNHIEHYRPKKEYYWLAYSWDNLLLSCPKCNLYKGSKFEINKKRVKYDGQTLEKLHNKTFDFDKFENPKLINPEQVSEDELNKQLTFNLKGEIKPMSERMNYTVETCKLNRNELKIKRKKVLNNFNIQFELHKDKKEALKIIKTQIENSIEKNGEYIAWKDFLLKYINKISNGIS